MGNSEGVGVPSATGDAAVNGVAPFLTRIDALESGSDPERQGTKKDDKKAVELLAARGLDKAERARLQALVNVALGPTSTLPQESSGQTAEERRAALTKLRDWFDEWAATARAVVKKACERAGLA